MVMLFTIDKDIVGFLEHLVVVVVVGGESNK
jgi:hypothetical protein